MKYYFTGIAGTGMSALAQIAKMQGNEVIGSDRSFDLGQNIEIKNKFENLGIKIFPQNGSGISKDIDKVIVSTAVEDTIIDIVKAKELGLNILHRSDYLSSMANQFKTIAVGGTSGKSTVTALIFHLLKENKISPSIITGGALNSLIKKNLIGNAFKGESDILIIEADESDGTIEKYKTEIGIILNISKDHKEIPDLIKIFSKFAKNSKKVYLNLKDENSKNLIKEANFFGFDDEEFKVENIKLNSSFSTFNIKGIDFKMPFPGLYNIFNALCSLKICYKEFSISLEDLSKALISYEGVYRRYDIIGEKDKIIVIDDYAHNPCKIEALLQTAHIDKEKRVLAIYQPHGFAPTRLLKNDLIEIFNKNLNERDFLFMPEIYYVGGSVNKNISSLDIIKPLKENNKNAFYFEKRDDIINEILKIKKENDLILIIGARDNSLKDFAVKVYNSL